MGSNPFFSHAFGNFAGQVVFDDASSLTRDHEFQYFSICLQTSLGHAGKHDAPVSWLVVEVIPAKLISRHDTVTKTGKQLKTAVRPGGLEYSRRDAGRFPHSRRHQAPTTEVEVAAGHIHGKFLQHDILTLVVAQARRPALPVTLGQMPTSSRTASDADAARAVANAGGFFESGCVLCFCAEQLVHKIDLTSVLEQPITIAIGSGNQRLYRIKVQCCGPRLGSPPLQWHTPEKFAEGDLTFLRDEAKFLFAWAGERRFQRAWRRVVEEACMLGDRLLKKRDREVFLHGEEDLLRRDQAKMRRAQQEESEEEQELV